MRRRIQQLARGKFEQAKPFLTLQTDKIDIEVLEGQDYTGDFVITSANRVPMRGIIYSSNPRMECLTPQFEGEEVRIRYQFHSYGLVEGDIQKGEFCIVVNQGEYNLSFVASISRLYADSSIGKIKNLNDFTQLAKESSKEAYCLFYSAKFRNLLHTDNSRELLLYEGLSRGTPSAQRVEEFLVSIHKKEKVKIELEQTKAEFSQVTAARKEVLQIRKNQWGYLNIRVKTDAPFLQVEKNQLTEEDFIGSVCSFSYYVVDTRMHAGKNYGTISFELPGKTIPFVVCASGTAVRTDGEEKKQTEHRDIRQCQCRLLELYIDYRLKKIVTGAWANKSIEILDHLSALQKDEPMHQLMKAQAFIINCQRQEASWIMEDFKRNCMDRTTPVWGYYLYLCTLVEREPVYVDKVTNEIEQIFHKYPDNSMLFWILLFVKEDYYQNNARRLKAIREWMKKSSSPYFYLEAYYLIWQDTYLLTKLEPFEIEVLNWAGKHGAITKDIAAQVMQIIPEKKEFIPRVYRILEECYRVEPKDEMLAAICGYLIKSQRFEHSYHRWYELGIANEIRITSLYEAYLMSMDSRSVADVPKMIQMYFQYDSGLPYQQKAVLFVNIIAAKEVQPEVYQKYRRTMEQFAMEQIEAGHMNDNLAVIYDEMLEAGILNKDLSEKLASILFTHKFTCLDLDIVQITVVQKQLKEVETIPVSGKTAYFRAYTDDYCLILEDTHGNRFCESILYQDETLMRPEKYISQCLKLTPDFLSYQIYQLHDKTDYTEFTENDSGYFAMILQSEKICDNYKAFLAPQIVRYYQKREYEGVLGKYLSNLDYKILSAESRRLFMELLVEEHLYELAYKMVLSYGYDYLLNAARVSLCSYAITAGNFEEDDFLTGFAEAAFESGKYNDVILIYLCKYYNGATKVMAKLWKAAGAFRIDTFDLEERIITQVLYSTDYVADLEQVYESYVMGGGRELVCMAYISYFAHEYLVKDTVVPEHIFIQIKQRYLAGAELNDACRLGLLKYYAALERLTGEQLQVADELLGRFTAKNMYFAFYRQFCRKLIQKYHLYDKFFIEYHANPLERVVIHYSMDGESYKEEEMVEMYEGIFVKEFILFLGEAVQYYITEEDEGSPKVTESDCLRNQNMIENETQGRYGELNEILLQMTLDETDRLKRKMKNYYGMKTVTEKVFDLQ